MNLRNFANNNKKGEKKMNCNSCIKCDVRSCRHNNQGENCELDSIKVTCCQCTDVGKTCCDSYVEK